MKYVVIALIGALASILANKSIAVFNDGFRPIVPQYLDGDISRKELATMSFAISFGLVIGFGIPTSIAATIILIHCILLTTDIIGTWCPDNTKGTIMAGSIGAFYGVFLLIGLEWLVTLFGMLPYNFLGALGGVSKYIIISFAFFPALAVAYQHGFNKGIISAIVTFVVYIFSVKFAHFSMNGYLVSINPAGLAMMSGAIMMVVYAAKVKSVGNDANSALVNFFSKNVERIRSNWILLALMGALVATATSLSIVAGDPASLALLSNGQYTEAALTAFARGLGFIPLVLTTAIVTGVYSPVGCTFVFTVGLLCHGNPILAFVLGAAVIVIELALINIFGKGMDKFPGMKDMGEHIRTSMNDVLSISLLLGGVAASETMAAAVGLTGFGAMFVLAVLLLNRKSKKPIVELAVGPVACIAFGVLINILVIVNLVTLVVA